MGLRGRRRAGDGLEVSPGRAFILVSGVLAVAAVMNADQLLEESEGMPFGGERDFWVAVWEPVDSLSEFSLLDRPREWMDEALGRGPNEPSFLLQAPEEAEPLEVAVVVPEVDPAPRPVEHIAPQGPAVDVAEVLEEVELPGGSESQALRTPTPDQPLRIWVGGDSLSVRLAQSLGRDGTDSGVMDVQMYWEVATGLARPDVFDWGFVLANVADEWEPDVYVVVLGGNDTQKLMAPDGSTVDPMTDAWRAEYARRVGGMMDQFSAPGKLFVWVGLPPAKDGELSAKYADINNVVMAEAERRDGVVFVDAWQLLDDGQGGYTAYLPDGAGNMELVREPDGVHMTRAGGDLLAAAVLDVIEREAALVVQATPEP